MVKRGFYKHYKGGLYFVFGVGKHSETQEELVLYYSLHNFSFWARPVKMWTDMVGLEPYDYKHNILVTRRFERVTFWQALSLLHKK